MIKLSQFAATSAGEAMPCPSTGLEEFYAGPVDIEAQCGETRSKETRGEGAAHVPESDNPNPLLWIHQWLIKASPSSDWL